MKIYVMKSNVAAQNLATEYYLLKNLKEKAILLWQNDNCVVIGRNQNIYNEIDLSYIKENNIDVVRRVSGGGAVFHDLGNVNYSIIEPSSETKTIDFEKYMNPIVNYLNKLNVNAQINGRNDIVINNKKISGNAQYFEDGKVLHHGTLIFDINKNHLSNCLKVNEDKLATKGIKSTKSRITSIKENIDANINVNEFVNYLEQSFMDEHDNISKLILSNEDIINIEKLQKNMFENTTWTYGEKFNPHIRNVKYIEGVGLLEVNIDLTNENQISKFEIKGDFFAKKSIQSFCEQFINIEFTNENIQKIINEVENFDELFWNLNKIHLIQLITNNNLI